MRTLPITHLLETLFISAIAAGCGGSAAQQPPSPVAPPRPADTAVASAPTASAAPVASTETKPKEAPHWKYAGAEGPDQWGTLWPDWERCKTGVEQSPIDLPKQGEKPAKALALATAYGKLPLQILNNGHTVQVPALSAGKLTLDGVDFELQQFHLHSPSEHSVAGVKFDGELHLVHKSANSELAVIGLLLKKGKENKTLAPVFTAVPAEESHDAKPVANATVDLTALVPAKSSYYSYNGSLTTPPCSEGVRWFVLTKPVEVSEAQLKKFQEVMHGGNARPVLPLGSRKVQESHP